MTCRASSLLIFRRACSTSSSFLASVDLMAAFRALASSSSACAWAGELLLDHALGFSTVEHALFQSPKPSLSRPWASYFFIITPLRR